MSSRKLLQLASRQFSSTPARTVGAKEVNPGYYKLRVKQEHFQLKDGKPVHLKGGMRDHVFYYGSVLFTVVCLLVNFNLYYELAFPKRK